MKGKQKNLKKGASQASGKKGNNNVGPQGVGDTGGPLGFAGGDTGGPLGFAGGNTGGVLGAGDSGGPLGGGDTGGVYGVGDIGGVYGMGDNGGVLGGCPRGMGYHPDLPDHRDSRWQAVMEDFVKQTADAPNERVRPASKHARAPLPSKFFIGERTPLPAVEDQGQTNSCTAQAAAGLLEYLYHWATGGFVDFSRMFIYYNSRKLLSWKGDTGSYIRTTFKSMRLFGAPPEDEWLFDTGLMDVEPQPYHYSFASNFKTMKYARLDYTGRSPEEVLEQLKRTLFIGFPVEFGFPVYSSIQRLQKFVIPVPANTDSLLGGHAVLAVGYDDEISYLVPKTDSKGKQLMAEKSEAKGAIIIRNSWGPNWGDRGYGYLPYWYFNNGYAADLWTAYDRNWLDLKQFENP